MTKVRFTFVDVQGNPLPLMEFKLIVRRASFNDEEVGVTLPEQLTVVTDATGQVIVDLWPLKTAYRIQIAEEYEELCGKLNWSFYVPHTDQIVEAQSLFLVPAPNNIPWDEEAIGKITQAVIDSHDSAVAADASADRAELAATTIAGDAQSARDSAADALLSKNSAAASATTASDAATAAGLSKVAAKASEDAADASELAAGQSAATAGIQAGVATDASNLAKRWASDNENVVVADGKESSYSYSRKAATSATSAADYAGISGTQAGLATAAKTAAEVAAVTATAKAGEASASAATALTEANRSKAEADRAQGYASALTGALVEAGSIDLTSNQYPAKPQFSSFWKVVVGGVVGGVDYGIGDTLVYSKTLDQFYKIDNTESVSSVNGKTGAVSLVKSDVGLSQVDNTSDANKPVSTAQQTALNGKQASAANLTAFAGLTGAVDQLPYFTGAGALSLATLTAKARLLMARTDTAGMQSELGLVPVTSNIDATAGRLVTPGWMGLGALVGVPLPNADANADLPNGRYITTTAWTGSPYAGTAGSNQGYLVSDTNTTTAYVSQEFSPLSSSLPTMRRFKSAGVWGAWEAFAMLNSLGVLPVASGGTGLVGNIPLDPTYSWGGTRFKGWASAALDGPTASAISIGLDMGYAANRRFQLALAADGKLYTRVNTASEPTDRTSWNSLIATGDFGIGSNAVPKITDFIADVKPGWYYAYGDSHAQATVNAPPGSGAGAIGVITLQSINSVNYKTFLAASQGGSGSQDLFVGSRWSTDAPAWRRVITDGNATLDPALNTGGIVFSGSNANGEYTKFADGTLICVFRASATSTIVMTSASGGYYYGTASVSFPAPFIAAPKVTNCTASAASLTLPLYASAITGSGCTLFQGAPTSQASIKHYISYTAIGRWKA